MSILKWIEDRLMRKISKKAKVVKFQASDNSFDLTIYVIGKVPDDIKNKAIEFINEIGR